MPRVHFSITRKFADQWDDYWRCRPTVRTPDRADVLLESEVVTDFTPFMDRPTANAEFWVTPAMPEHFIVAAVEGEEWKVVAIRRRKPRRPGQLVDSPKGDRTQDVGRLAAEVERLSRRVAELERLVQPGSLIEVLRGYARKPQRPAV